METRWQTYVTTAFTSSRPSFSARYTLPILFSVSLHSRLILRTGFVAPLCNAMTFSWCRRSSFSPKTIAARDEPSTPSKMARYFSKVHPNLISHDDVPHWYRNNMFILRSYRPESNSTLACFQSWLYLHNESINIFSHLLPGIGAVVA